MKGQSELPSRKPVPPTLGLAVVADLWLWGALLLFAPSYFSITSRWQILFYVPGSIFLIVSFGGALMELGKLWKTEGLSYWGASLVLLIPAAALYFAVGRQLITGIPTVIAKAAALVLAAIGGALFFQGIPYLFWKQNNKGEEPSPRSADMPDVERKKQTKRKASFEVIANIIIALLSLTTAVVTLAEKLSP